MVQEQVLIQHLGIVISPGPENCRDEALLRSFMSRVVERTKMTIIIPPLFVELPIVNFKTQRPVKEGDVGLTGLCGIAESHMAIHSWPEYDVVWFEMSSCKLFGRHIVEAVVVECFPAAPFCVEHTSRHLPAGEGLIRKTGPGFVSNRRVEKEVNGKVNGAEGSTEDSSSCLA